MNLKGPRPDGTAIVSTGLLTDTRRACQEALDLHGFVTVQGDPGLGKTESVRQAGQRSGADYVHIHLDAGARGYAFTRGFLRKCHLSTLGDGDDLLERAVAHLKAHPRTLVVADDADFLHRDSLRHVQLLYDEEELEFGLVLVAVDFSDPFRLVPGLGSRVTSELHFAPLTGDPLSAAIRAYHPGWARLPKKLIEEIDEEHCHGVWRAWVTLTRKVLYYQRLTGAAEITRAFVAAALASRTGQP